MMSCPDLLRGLDCTERLERRGRARCFRAPDLELNRMATTHGFCTAPMSIEQGFFRPQKIDRSCSCVFVPFLLPRRDGNATFE